MDGGREVGELKGRWGGEPEPGPHIPCKSWGQRGNQAGKLYNPHFQRNTVSPFMLGKRGLKRLFALSEFCFVLFFKSGSLEKALGEYDAFSQSPLGDGGRPKKRVLRQIADNTIHLMFAVKAFDGH